MSDWQHVQAIAGDGAPASMVLIRMCNCLCSRRIRAASACTSSGTRWSTRTAASATASTNAAVSSMALPQHNSPNSPNRSLSSAMPLLSNAEQKSPSRGHRTFREKNGGSRPQTRL